jgi:transglutaminase-like putative cysteine protease
MNRRNFLQSLGIASAAVTFPAAGGLLAEKKDSELWRVFEVTTKVEVLDPAGGTRIWLPVAMHTARPFQRTIASKWTASGASVHVVEREPDGLKILSARFPSGVKPAITLTNQVATRDWNVDLDVPRPSVTESRETLQYFLRPTRLLPTDGIVKETADEITSKAGGDEEKARAVYEWIVENTFRDPKTRGCGDGDIRFMLQTRDLGGKCADLNALYVGLARAAGLPARDVYGIRVAKSDLGYKSLGAATGDITKSQHCRAEVYLNQHGWVPVDPADVRKVVLEEPPGNRPLDDSMVSAARKRLFGSWEMNWIAYNYGHDVALPGSRRTPLGFLMYPQAETAEKSLDSLNPDDFRYEISAQEIHSVDL